MSVSSHVSGAAGVAARSKVLMQRVLDESIRGSNHEALLCLQKEIAGSWSTLIREWNSFGYRPRYALSATVRRAVEDLGGSQGGQRLLTTERGAV